MLLALLLLDTGLLAYIAWRLSHPPAGVSSAEFRRFTVANAQAVAELIAEVREQKTVIDGVDALMDKLYALALENAGDPAAFKAAMEELRANKGLLNQAVVEHTIAENEPTPPVQG